MSQDEGAKQFYGPYGMTLLEPWNGLGVQARTDLAGLCSDLARWSELISTGDAARARYEIEEALIQFRNAKHPHERLCEANARAAAATERSPV